MRFLSVYLLIVFLSCKSREEKASTSQAAKTEASKKYSGPCGCALTDKQMIMLCPIDAIGDSVVICKVGTNDVIGSHRSPMTWPEYIASEYFGGEGKLVSCKTGKDLLSDTRSPVISYRNKKLNVDNRYKFEVYDSRKKSWIDIELPVWRKTVYAVNNELMIAPDSLVFKPVLQGKDAFADVAKEYENETKRSDHYMITRTVYRLLSCALCGDQTSEKRLLSTRNDFSAYYENHPESVVYLDESLKLLAAYKSYIDKGGKRNYYDLSNFVFLKNPTVK